MPARARARFVAPMLLLRTEALPDDPVRWLYELKMDGYRAVAYKSGGTVHLRSRNDNDFSRRYPGIPRGLAAIPDDTMIDGKWWRSIPAGGRRSTRCRTPPRPAARSSTTSST